MSRDARAEKVAEVLRAHLPDSAYSSGCRLACGYDGDDLDVHLAVAVLDALDDDAQATRMRDGLQPTGTRGWWKRTIRAALSPEPTP